MATSSILTELVIEDPKKAEAFINALELSSQDPVYQNYQGEVELESVFRLYKQSKENGTPECRGLEQAA